MPLPIPETLWDGSSLYLPPPLLRAYRSALARRGLEVISADGSEGVFGGQSVEDARAHFARRFGVSACRQLAVLVDPHSSFGPIPAELATIMSCGRVAILDLACGAGAATLALLAGIAEYRTKSVAPSLPLNIDIWGADFSGEARAIFEELVQECSSDLAQAGVVVHLRTVDWDATVTVSTRDLFERFSEHAGAESELLVVVANISHAAGSGDGYDAIRGSLDHVKVQLAHRGTLQWLEPRSNRSTGLLKRIKAAVRHLLRIETSEYSGDCDWFDALACKSRPCRVLALLVPKRPLNGI